MSTVSLPISVRFKADLSAKTFSEALSAAVDGDISKLVLAFRPSGQLGECEDAQQQIIDQVLVSRAEVVVEADDGPVGAASKSIRRSINPSGRNGDPTVYRLQNLDGRTTKGTQVELRRKLGIGIPKLYQLLNTPGRVTREGWYRPTTRAPRGSKGE